jgi:hypothetical protein
LFVGEVLLGIPLQRENLTLVITNNLRRTDVAVQENRVRQQEMAQQMLVQCLQGSELGISLAELY